MDMKQRDKGQWEDHISDGKTSSNGTVNRPSRPKL
jgi:hypothetical protein